MGSSGFIPGIVLKLQQSICRKSCWDNMRFGRTSNYLLQFQWHQMASLCETQTQPLAVPIHWNMNNSITYPSNSQTFTNSVWRCQKSPWKLAQKNDDCDAFHLFSDCCHTIQSHTIQSLMLQDAGKCRLLVIIHIHYLLPIGCTLIQTKPRCFTTKRPSEKELIWGPLGILIIWGRWNLEILEIVPFQPFQGDMLIFGRGGEYNMVTWQWKNNHLKIQLLLTNGDFSSLLKMGIFPACHVSLAGNSKTTFGVAWSICVFSKATKATHFSWRKQVCLFGLRRLYGGFLKWWVSPKWMVYNGKPY